VKQPRLLLYGLLAGLLLSALRAPEGLDWTQLGAVSASTAAFFPVGALIAIALFLDRGRSAFHELEVWPLLLAIAVGFAFHGLVLEGLWRPEGRLGYGLLLVLATLALRKIAGPARRDLPDGGQDDDPDRLDLGERLGIAVSASGATLALQNLIHHVSLLGLGLPEDDTVIGTVFLLTLAIGALAFGGLVARPTWQRTVTGVGLTLTAVVTLFGLGLIASLGPDPLYRYLHRFDLDFSRMGTWQVTGLLAGAALVVPGFVAGTTLSGARHPARLASIVLGIAVGLLLTPHVIEAVARPLDAPDYTTDAYAFRMLATGCALAFVGTVALVVRARGRLRVVALALSSIAVLFPWMRGGIVVSSFSPWATASVQPEFVLPTPEGIVTVERTPRGAQIVTLDRKRVSPTGQEELVDRRRITYAFALLDPAEYGDAGPDVLFVGQMTRPRARVLSTLAPMRLDRTAPWFSALEEVESRLFPTGFAPPGDLIAPAEARSRIRNGEYDLVLVMPTHGPVLTLKSHARLPWGAPAAPTLGGLKLPAETLAVAWFDAGSNIVRSDLGDHALLAMDRFQYLSVAAVRGPVPQEDSPERPLLFPPGSPQRGLGAWELLNTPGRDRYFPLRRLLCERLAEAAEGTDAEHVARGMALHYAGQKQSSPYETVAQRIEVSEDELRAFHAGAATIDLFTRSVWEGLAWLLTEKRMADMALAYLEGVADKFTPWPELDHAVAIAYLEFLELEDARRFARRGLEAAPADPGLLQLGARLATELGEHDRAVELLRQALLVRPDDYQLRRSLGLALSMVDDPEGREILERLFQMEPEDPVLIEALEIGPSPDGGG